MLEELVDGSVVDVDEVQSAPSQVVLSGPLVSWLVWLVVVVVPTDAAVVEVVEVPAEEVRLGAVDEPEELL